MLNVDKKTGELVITPYSKFMHQTESMDLGSMIIPLQDFSWDDDVRDFIVVDAGKEDRQAYIDSFKDDTGVYNVLKKYAATGDVSLLRAREGFYGDISDLPVDELNPGLKLSEAEKSIEALSKKLGVELTAEKLAAMSTEDLHTLIESATKAREEKVEVKEGE